MKVFILGAGVIGVSTAYFLRKEGFDVTVIDRHEHGAMESTFANGGQLSYSHADPLASWQNVWQGLKWLGQKDAPLMIRPFSISPSLIKWFLQFFRNCPNSKREQIIDNLLRLSFFSRKTLHELCKELTIKFDWQKKGILYLLSDKPSFEYELSLFKLYQKYADMNFEILSNKECLNYDPSLERLIREKYMGILTKEDEIGDARKFTNSLEKICKKMGVNFIYDCEIVSFQKHNSTITGVNTSIGFLNSDKYICCLGAYSSKVLLTANIKLNIYPIKGYSTSVPIIDKNLAPKTSIFDMSRKIVYTRIGSTLRTAGSAEFCGFDYSINESRVKPLLDATKKFFPGAADYSLAKKWSCLRPTTPQYIPYLGKTKYNNLYVNTEHGFLGWTTGIGSAKIVADIFSGKLSSVKLDGINLSST